MYLDDMMRILKATAPNRPTSSLRRMRRLLIDAAQADSGSRKVGRIPSSVDLVNAATKYSEAAVAAAPNPFERARRLRDSAMIAFLAMMPIRRRNFAGLELGRTVRVEQDFIEGQLPPDEVKNARRQVFILQEPAAGLVRRYLLQARPFLAAQGPVSTSHLWLADTGRPYALG